MSGLFRSEYTSIAIRHPFATRVLWEARLMQQGKPTQSHPGKEWLIDIWRLAAWYCRMTFISS